MQPDTRGAVARLARPLIGAAVAAALLSFAPPASRAADAPPPPDYHPSMGDLMTMTVQPRHTKLGLAGRARNWPYLTYEVDELRNAFNRVIKLNPVYRKTDMVGLFASNMKDPLDQLEAAIKAKDAKGFDKGYAAVTHACNTCHQGLEHAFVVIKTPIASDYPDQSFTAAAK